ncbi:group II intron reverse transcriptase/maturase [Lyngbya sp. CCAP 1446/10]|uniref:group II intron reverse transcriptase/maturase n=1 Tax=Lyngbya sp. CCAP 1446/10 TaxID=439293 RepID=UPI00223906F1|nr:group II intron reverse transcriptase/maturase [Lyngbya sp. CCAP 1446/10]MCW6051346.1 group II intron reverse transcriptase/maturase [Lyngbya sp. CCAP 1446/10]
MSMQYAADFDQNREVLATSLVEEFLRVENFQRAWEKVAANQGAAGIDAETIDDFRQNLQTNLFQLRKSVANSSYQAHPCKQVLIPKNQGSWRELKIPAVRDRIVQQALLNVLAPIWETKFSCCSFAYRPNLSYLDAVEAVARWRDLGYSWVLDADIAQYFDNIDHQRLLREVRKQIDNPGILCLIKSWIAVGLLTQDGVIRTEKGIPQGSVISPMLANIYLDDFDKFFSNSGLQLVRYADDFVVLARTKEQIIGAYSQVERLLNSMGLALHPDKTRITNFDRGFRFLGHGFLESAIFPLESPQNLVQLGAKQSKASKKKGSRSPYKSKRKQR